MFILFNGSTYVFLSQIVKIDGIMIHLAAGGLRATETQH